MTPNECPQHVLAKLFALQSHVEACTRDAADAERQRDLQRTELGRGPASMREHKSGTFDFAAEQSKLASLTQRATALRQIATIEVEILKRCRIWIEQLPNGTPLEPVNPKLNGDTLEGVRSRLNAIQQELQTLQSAPTPGDDLRTRVQAYVDGLAAAAPPELQGIGQGETLRVYWPAEAKASRRNLNGFDTAFSNALLMFAWLEPNLLVDRLVAVANQIGDRHGPAALRPQRIAALEGEVLPLRYVEETLVSKMLASGEAAVRDPQALPECVLQVKVRAPAVKPKPAPREAQYEEAIGAPPG